MKITLFAALAFLNALHSALAQLAPSPTESIGCEPHEDHWHCEGPRPTVGPEPEVSTPVEESPATITATEEEDHDDHDHDDHEGEEEETGVLPPSPTASIGCEPHGDHWHCEGPANTSADSDDSPAETPSTTTTAFAQVPTGAAAGLEAIHVAPFMVVAVVVQAAFAM